MERGKETRIVGQIQVGVVMSQKKDKSIKIPTWPEETEVMTTRAEEEIRETDCNNFGMFQTDSKQCGECPVHGMCKYIAKLGREK